MLEWLGDAVQAVLRFVPRISIVRSTHRGVAFVRGRDVHVIQPGLYVWWPLITECLMVPVVRQSLDLPVQTLTTKDGLSIIVSGVVIYTIRDIKVALTEQWDVDETIRVMSQAAVRDVVCSVTFEYLNQNRYQFEGRLKTALSKELSAYGVEVVDSKLTDFARTSVLAIAGTNLTNGVTPIGRLDESAGGTS